MCQQDSTRSAAVPSGFTLVEIMVVIVILGLLATLVIANVGDNADRAREQVARTNATGIAHAVRAFRAREGRLPASLSALVQVDVRGRRDLEALPRDPWGHEFLLIQDDVPPGWEVVSAGPDGDEGTEDDISSRPKTD